MSQIPNYFARQPVTRQSPTTTAPAQQQGRFGDAVDAFQAGGLSAVGGIFDFVGADGIAKQFYGWSDSQQDTMSDRGKTAMGKSFFSENEQGETVMGEGLTDIDTWLLTLANVAGQFVPTAIPGAGAAGAVAKAASLGAKGRAAANVVGMGATGGAAATGQGMEQARDEVRNMPDAVLAESPIFRDVFKGIYQSKPEWTDEQKWDAAKDAIAAKVADEVRSDPKVLLANFGASAIGDPIIGKALMGARLAKSGALRSAAKGFTVEGSTEAAQAGVSQYAINEALQPLDNRDAMQGVTTAALNEGIAGGGFGAAAGGIGGMVNRNAAQTVQPVADPVADAIRDTNPELAGAFDSLNETMASSQAAIDELINYDQPTAARNAGFNTDVGAGQFGDLLTSPAQQSLDQLRARTVADLVSAAAQFTAPTPQDRFSPVPFQYQGEVLPAQERLQLPRGGQTIDAQQTQFLPQDQQRLPQKDIVFAGNETGVTVKQSGKPFQSPKEALASKSARDARKAGNQIEAVPFDDGYGWRVSVPVEAEQTGTPIDEATKISQGTDTNVGITTSDQAEITETEPAAEIDATPAQPDATPINNAEPAADLAGAPIDPEWTAFADETGTKKVPRAEMPQIKAEHRGALTQFMKGRGITHEQQTVPATELKPTQAEFSPGKVKKAMEFDGGNRSILVSSDGYVLDGHHQWLAAREKGEPVEVIRLDAPIDELIPLAKEFPSSTVSDGATESNAQVDTPAPSAKPTLRERKEADRKSNQVAAEPTATAKLPEVLRVSKNSYLKKQAEKQQLREASPGYEQALARLEEQYDTDVDRALAGLTFEQFNALNSNSPESINRQAYEQLREEFGLPADIQFSKTVNKADADQYRAELANSLKSLKTNVPIIRIGKTPDVLVRLGVPSLDLGIWRDTVRKATNGVKHSVSMKDIEQLPEHLSDPIAVFQSKSHGKVVLIDAVDANGDPVIAAIHMEQKEGRQLVINRVASIYGKENAASALAGFELEYIDKNKNPELVRHLGLIPRSGSPSRGSDTKVLTKEDLVKENPDISFAAANFDEMRNRKAKGVPAAQVEMMAKLFMKKLNNAAGIKVVVLRDQQDAELKWNMSLSGSIVRGAYDDKTKTAYLIAGNFDSIEHARRTLAHEVIAHGGLQSVIGAKTYRDFLMRINATRTRASFRPAWNGIMRDYGNLTPEKQAEEFFARWVEDQPETGSLKYWWKALVRWLNNQLAKVGITRAENNDVAAMRDMLDSIVQGFKSGRAPRRQQGKAVAFDKSGDVTETEAFKRWFGDSKVVDEDGKPLVVYHGSDRELDRVTPGYDEDGGWFAENRKVAADYAKGDTPAIHNVYLKIENPLIVDFDGHDLSEAITIDGKEFFENYDIATHARTNGYDGVYFPYGNFTEQDGTWVIFKEEQVKSADENNGDFDPTNPDIRFSRTATPDTRTAKEKLGLGEQADETLKEKATARYRETADTLKSTKFWQRLNEGIFDGMAGIKQAEDSVGITDPNRQGYVSARLASGLADVLHGVFNYGAPEWRNGVVARKADTKGLLEVFSSLGDDLNNWLAWMGANRAEKLMAEGRENNLTADDIAELKALADGKEAKFEEVRQEYNKINSAIIDLAQQAGLISDAQRSGFDEEWYVPFFRDMDVDPEMQGIAAMVHGPKSKNGIANQNAQLKELKGGKQSTKDLLENIIQRQSTLIDAALKNNAMLEIVGNLSGTDYMQPVTSPEIAALSQTELNLLSKVKVMRDGKPEAYAVSDPALLRGLLQINDAGSKSLFNRLGRSAKRFLTAGITLSPDFIVKNFVRDAAHAWMVNKDDFTFGADSIKGLRKAFKEDEAYRDLIFSGAAFQGGYIHGADPEAATQQVRRALKAKGLTVNEVNSYMDSLVTKGGQLLEKYRNASDKVENANRLMTYEAALRAGKSKRQAAFEGKDLMDYSLKGNFALIGTMIDFLPFFNARLQGLSKLVRAAKAGDGDRVLKVLSANLAMKGMKVAAFSLALAAMNDDDERYQELADWDKDSNWHFWLGDQHLRIPKPFELGIVFGTFPERMLHYGTGTQPASDLGKAVGHAVFNTLALNPIPQLALPAVEVMVNRSFFKDSSIEGMADENRQPGDRYNAYTSEVAKQLGQLFNVSPKKIEHLVKGYTGTIGGYVLSASDIVARQMLGIESADTPISRYPVVKAFYQGDAPKTNTKFQQEFYDALDAAGQAYGSYKKAAEEGDTQRQRKILEANKEKLSSRIPLNRLQRQLSELNKQAERVNNNSSLTGAQKRERLDEITRRKNALYHAGYVRFNLGEW
jgi:hypothetical protein